MTTPNLQLPTSKTSLVIGSWESAVHGSPRVRLERGAVGGSEADAESELHHARLIRDVGVECRLPEERAAPVRRIRTEVLVIEQIEHLEHPVEGQVARVHALLQPRVDAVDRPADDAVARQDGAVRGEPLFGGGGGAFIAAILAGHRGEAFTRSVEVDAAGLDAHAEIDHTVDDRTVTLIAGLAEAARHLRP